MIRTYKPIRLTFAFVAYIMHIIHYCTVEWLQKYNRFVKKISESQYINVVNWNVLLSFKFGVIIASKKKYKCVFNDFMRENYPFTKKCKRSVNKFYCKVCDKEVRLAADGTNDILWHGETKVRVDRAHQSAGKWWFGFTISLD